MMQINHLLTRLRWFPPVFQASKYCALSRKNIASTAIQARISSVAETTLPKTPAIKTHEKSSYFFDLYLPDEDHPDYALWEQGMLKSLETMDQSTVQESKIEVTTAKEPIQNKSSADPQKVDPLYLDWNRRVREIEERLFKKCNEKKEFK